MAEKIQNLPQNLIKLVDFKDFGIGNMLDNGDVRYIVLDSVGVLIMNTFKHLVFLEQFENPARITDHMPSKWHIITQNQPAGTFKPAKWRV